MLVDSHCHLSSKEIYDDLDRVIERAKEVGVSIFLNAAAKFDELDKQLEISNRFHNIWTVTGVHPHDSMAYETLTLEEVLKKTAYDQVVGIGECGLDYFYDFSPKSVQKKVFRTMIKAAQKSGLPLIVHTRDADEDTISMLESAWLETPFKAVIHCFSSSEKLAMKMLELGFYISASGIITFKNSAVLRSIFQKVPLDRLLIETDTPYLAPMPMRGHVNEPAFIVHTARTLAEIKGVSFEEIATATTKNFLTLFDKVRRHG